MQLWALGIATSSGRESLETAQVKWASIVFLQDMKICDPEGRDRIEEKSAQTFNCSLSCVGMYADIAWKDEQLKDEKDKDKYSTLSSQYHNFKKEHVTHFRFSSEASSSMYGKQIVMWRNKPENQDVD